MAIRRMATVIALITAQHHRVLFVVLAGMGNIAKQSLVSELSLDDLLFFRHGLLVQESVRFLLECSYVVHV